MADPYFDSVGLLLHCNGADGSTAFVDASPRPKTVTKYANATVSTAQSAFGGAAALFSASGGYVSTPNHADLSLAAGDWTVELWVRIDGAHSGPAILATHGQASRPWQLWLEDVTDKIWVRGLLSDGSTSYSVQTPAAVSRDAWHHVAAVRDGATIRLFVDGVASGSTTVSGNLLSSASSLSFGAYGSGTVGSPLKGWLDDIRITKGVARYTAAFTPPDAEFGHSGDPVDARIQDDGLPGAPAALAVIPAHAYISDAGPLQQPAAVGLHLFGQISGDAVLGQPSARAWTLFAVAQLDSALGPAQVLGHHEFRHLVNSTPARYTMELATPGGAVVVPISSWQATLQTDSQCYAGCVIPNCAAWLDDIVAADEFTVYRHCTTLAGEPFKHQMVRAPLQSYQIDQGTTNYTCSLSGFFPAYAVDEAPHARHDATLTGLRSVSSYASGVRVRTAIDWLLQPAQRAYYGEGGANFVAAFLNYYVTGSDEYCDAGSRAAGEP